MRRIRATFRELGPEKVAPRGLRSKEEQGARSEEQAHDDWTRAAPTTEPELPHPLPHPLAPGAWVVPDWLHHTPRAPQQRFATSLYPPSHLLRTTRGLVATCAARPLSTACTTSRFIATCAGPLAAACTARYQGGQLFVLSFGYQCVGALELIECANLSFSRLFLFLLVRGL